MARKTIIYWRDIPSQVVVQRGRNREKAMLSPRFQEAIDRAAMRAGKGGSDAYIAEWRREATTVDSGDELQAIARAEAELLEAGFTDEQLDLLVRAHGVAKR